MQPVWVPITIQSSVEIKSVVSQIWHFSLVGCQVVRVAFGR